MFPFRCSVYGIAIHIAVKAEPEPEPLLKGPGRCDGDVKGEKGEVTLNN